MEFEIDEEKKLLIKCVNSAFEKMLYIPEGIRIIGFDVLEDPNNDISAVILPDSVEIIRERAFGFSMGLHRVTLGKGLRRIGDRAFHYCPRLWEVTFPDGIEYVAHTAFDNTTWSEEHSSGTVMLNNSCLYSLRSDDSELIIPEGVEIIGESAFSHNRCRRVYLPETLRLIHADAFWGCDMLEEIKLPEGVEEIGNAAFSHCSELKKVTLPSTLKRADKPFVKCHKDIGFVMNFTCRENINEVLSEPLCGNSPAAPKRIYAPNIPPRALGCCKPAACVEYILRMSEGRYFPDGFHEDYRQCILEIRRHLYGAINEFPAVLHYMCREGLIPRGDIDLLLEQCSDSVELKAALLEYGAALGKESYEL